MVEVEGRCPYCDTAMTHTSSVSWHGKSYTFPYSLYLCYRHGYFVWRGRKGHLLFELPKFDREATEISSIPLGVPENEFIKSSIKVLKCKFCRFKWRQFITPWVVADKRLSCPCCHATLNLEEVETEVG